MAVIYKDKAFFTAEDAEDAEEEHERVSSASSASSAVNRFFSVLRTNLSCSHTMSV